MNKTFFLSSILCALTLSAQSFGFRAPVEDLGRPNQLQQPQYLQNRQNDQQPQRRQLTFQQRLYRVEQQVQNVLRDDQNNKVEELQTQMQQLRGQLDQTKHELAVLSDQQKKFYTDLNDRIVQKSATQPSSVQAGSQATTQQVQPVAVNNAPVTAEESQAYQAAFELLKAKQYEEAITAFQKYLMQYPNGRFVVNSNYWLGEVYYLQGKATEAKKAFTVVVTNFPTSQKISDAMLKLAIISLDAGDNGRGRDMLNKVKEQYPGTTAARLAALRLQELNLSS